MRGEMPVPNMPAIATRGPYQRQVVMDGANNCDLKYAVGEIYSWDKATRTTKVYRPTADNLTPAQCVLFPGAEFDSDANAVVSAADFSFDGKAVLAGLDPDSDEPILGCSVGTVKDSWGLKVGNTGFTVVGLSTDEDPWVVYVRPAVDAGFIFYNDSGANIPAYSLVKIVRDDTNPYSMVHIGTQPDADSLKNCAVTTKEVLIAEIGLATRRGYTGGFPLKYTGIGPTVGNTVGTKSGQWEASAGKKGFVVLGIDDTEEIVFVYPFIEDEVVQGRFINYTAPVGGGDIVSSGGELSSSILRYNETTGELQRFLNTHGISGSYMVDGFVLTEDGCLVGDDLFVAPAGYQGTWDRQSTTFQSLAKYNRGTDEFDTFETGTKPTLQCTRMIAIGTKLFCFFGSGAGLSPTTYYATCETTTGAWTNLANTTDTALNDMCLWGTDKVVICTDSLVKYWDVSTGWSASLGAFNGLVEKVFTLDGDLYASGNFTGVSGTSIRGLAKYSGSGTTWSEVGGGIGTTTGSADVHAIALDGKIVCIGSFLRVGTGTNYQAWTHPYYGIYYYSIAEYDPDSDAWQHSMWQTGSFIYTHIRFSIIDDVLYILVGYNGRGYYTDNLGLIIPPPLGSTSVVGRIWKYAGPTSTPTNFLAMNFHGNNTIGSASNAFIVKLPKLDPGDDQQWLFGGDIQLVDGAYSERTSYFDGDAWQITTQTKQPMASMGSPSKAFTVNNRSFYLNSSIYFPGYVIQRLFAMCEMNPDENSWPVPAAWTSYFNNETAFRIWFPDYQFYYSSSLVGEARSAYGLPLMTDTATNKSLLFCNGGYCHKKPVDGSAESNIGGMIEIDWTNLTISAFAGDHGYAAACYAHAYCNGSWYCIQGDGKLYVLSGSTWSNPGTHPSRNWNVYFLYAYDDTHLLLYSASPGTGYHFWVYDTTDSSYTDHWDIWGVDTFVMTTAAVFWTRGSDSYLRLNSVFNYGGGSPGGGTSYLMRLNIQDKSVEFRSQVTMGGNIVPLSDRLLIISTDNAETNGDRYMASRYGYARALHVYKYDVAADDIVPYDDTTTGGPYAKFAWDDLNPTYGNILEITLDGY